MDMDVHAIRGSKSFSPFLLYNLRDRNLKKVRTKLLLLITPVLHVCQCAATNLLLNGFPNPINEFHNGAGGRRVYTSYIASVNILSNMDLKPRAPVFFAIALLAISRKASSVKCNLT